MARSLTPQDAYGLINLVVKEATGQNDTIQAVDASSFASVGDFLLAQGTENVLNALCFCILQNFGKAGHGFCCGVFIPQEIYRLLSFSATTVRSLFVF